MNSIKARLGTALAIALVTTLAMAGVLYFGAQSLDDTARSTRVANDEVRELLSFALVAHRYMNAFGQSLGQRTLIANNERRVSANLFEERILAIPSETDHSTKGLDWNALRAASNDLHRELISADALRASGDFYEAERTFNKARKTHFEQRMLPWFDSAIETQRAHVIALDAAAQREANTQRTWARYLAAIAALLSMFAAIAVGRAVIRPVRLLVEGTDAIARGDFAHRIPYEGRDEIGVLAARFNGMVDVVEKSQRSLLEKNAALEEAYRLQGEFLSIVSHELRSPLHSILGLTELIMEDCGELSASVNKNVQNVALGARRLLALINDILDFSKLKAGRMQTREDRFRVDEIARLVVDETRALVQGRAIDVRFQTSADAGEMRSDETKVRQILTNLMSNAVKFTDTGSVTLSVARPEEGRVEFRVADTGIGIPEEQLGIIFEPFRQARGADRRAVSGTGLGLAIVSRLSDVLGGTVTVNSMVGRGTEFAVSLPSTTASTNG